MATMPTATMASLNPFRNTLPSAASSSNVTPNWCLRNAGKNGFSMMGAVASAADNVIVMTKSVAAKPRRHNTKVFPRQRGSRSSSMEMLPWPCGLASATRR